MREIWFAATVFLSLAGTAPALAQAPATPPPAAAQGDPLALTPDDRILGKPDAPVTIIEYGSFTCPHCAHFAADVLPKVKAKWIDTGKARLVFRPFPRDEPDLRAAMVALCAPPDKFYAFADSFFAAQQQWVLASDWKAALARLALVGGMNKAKFDSCLADKPAEDKLLASRLAATQQLSVNSTPTFFINGTKFEGDPTVEGFDAALGRAAGS
jgi:protein-disulfide isomerase